jgi:hypothetical protein
MGVDDVNRYLLRRPFLPFRMHVSDGTGYEIHHPDQAMPTRTSLLLVGTGPEDELETVALLHITRLQPLGSRPPPLTNGV